MSSSTETISPLTIARVAAGGEDGGLVTRLLALRIAVGLPGHIPARPTDRPPTLLEVPHASPSALQWADHSTAAGWQRQALRVSGGTPDWHAGPDQGLRAVAGVVGVTAHRGQGLSTAQVPLAHFLGPSTPRVCAPWAR